MEFNSTNNDEDHQSMKCQIQSITPNCEQQQRLLVETQREEQITSRSSSRRTLYKVIREYFWIVVLLFIVIGVIGIAQIPRHKASEEYRPIDKSLDSGWYRTYALDKYSSQGKFQRQSTWNGVGYNERRESRQRERPIRYKSRPPENIGHMNIYISQPAQERSQRRFERFRFPVARYSRRYFPLTGPFVNFVPWMPIVADRFTKQTIIYSSTGVYLIPPLVNAYGKLYSVAELIASGYASLVSSGVQPPSVIDMRSFFLSTSILGPGVPTFITSTGGFAGNIRTNLGFFNIVEKPELLIGDKDSEEQESINYQPPSYMQIRHDRQRPRYTTRKTSSTSESPTTTTIPPIGPPDVNISGEVHRTLIIDQIFPYTTSQKPVLSANYSYPGPLLEAYEGDTFVIRVINRLTVPSTIHWHGMKQLGTPDMDGAVGVSQCAIPPKSEMIYRFNATPAGTTWYHGHLLEQYTDGLHGPLIIHKRSEPNQQLYDSEQILMIADWYNNQAHTELIPWYLSTNNPDGNEPSPDAIVVNGKFTQSLFITLSGSRRVRFRVINAAAFSMYSVSIDGLPLHIIELDTMPTVPYTVNSFDINVGQRVSFYINLDELVLTDASTGVAPISVFIRIQAVLSMYPVDIVNYIPPYESQRYPYPTFFNPLYVAILSFDSSNSTPTYQINQPTPTLPNALTPQETNLLDARPLDKINGGIPDATHQLSVVIVFQADADGINRAYLNDVTYSSDANYMHMRPDPATGITSDLYAPLLHQMIEKSQQLGIPLPSIQAGNTLPTIQSDGNGHYLVPYQAVLDVLVNNTDGGEHPFHLHGYTFWILATSDYSEAEFSYAGDYIQRDVVSIPASGWAKIRFVADNPGAWFFHCHIEWHMAAGLALTFLVAPERLLASGYTISQSQKDLCKALQKFNENIQAKS